MFRFIGYVIGQAVAAMMSVIDQVRKDDSHSPAGYIGPAGQTTCGTCGMTIPRDSWTCGYCHHNPVTGSRR